jgi:hypothetical protein
MINHFNQLYFALLPIPLVTSSIFGIINGINYGMNKKDQIESFSGMIGYTSLGIITGITYPISFPFLTGYILLKK